MEIAKLRPAMEKCLQGVDLATLLGLQYEPSDARTSIIEAVTIYSVTAKYTATLGSSRRLLWKLQRHLQPLVRGTPLRARDRKRRIDFLNRLIDPRSGMENDIYDAIAPLAGQLRLALAGADDSQQIAIQLRRAAEHQSQVLNRWLDNGRKVEGPREHKRYLCGLLGLIWKQHSSPEIRTKQVRCRQFVGAVLDAVSIPHPDSNDYQVFDAWIATDVSASPFLHPRWDSWRRH